MNDKMSFENALVRLQEIVSILEKGDEPLEKSLKLFEEGAGLSAHCYENLKNAEQRITEISEKLRKENENE
ncbi:MAG: exodeoxyribonuclease VII small subunit [Oscillospiraceae bacterium]